MATDSVSTVFSKGKFCVPDYQRPFSWGADEITDFFNDLKEHIESGNGNGYLFGMIIVYNRGTESNPVYDIIDGQQRIATSTIFSNNLP